MKELLFFTIVIFSCIIVKTQTKRKLKEFESETFKMEGLKIANSQTNNFNKLSILGIFVVISILVFLFR